ncbi:hypothetical protein LguiA_011890 [Lonicera macranthoides]
MGDLRVFCYPQNASIMEDRLYTTASVFAPPPNPDPSSIRAEIWAVAEETTRDVVNCIHPTLDSEEKRKDVIDYIQRLIRGSLGCEVFPYGSVPLKTYLPDGDIDLTALSSPNVEESLARDVLAVLKEEEYNENAEFELKDTQFIDAEVKLVKCLVQNIVIDISFNQLGGLCTLCFLEQVDRLVGKDHLFKRSIILIKAWCYYESRILGAHHGLISTYALETLVLYIFHLFNSSLNGPLAVFYRFLDYFSKFDWENYCISLNGPVRKSSLPDIVVEKPGNEGDELMLTEEFMRNCVDMFSVPSRGLETNLRAFPQKHLNIIDPLKENNNLGRSVHRGNYYRIRSAFKYGARKLGRILVSPRERIADEIKNFFSNTMRRHGRKYGADITNDTLIFGAKGFGTFCEDEMPTKPLSTDFDDDMSEVEDKLNLGYRHKLDRYTLSGSSKENESFENGNPCQNNVYIKIQEGVSARDSGILSPNANISETLSLDFRERTAIGGDIETLNPLSDLSGDYDSHIRSLLYGQFCHGHAVSAPSPRSPTPPIQRHQFQNRRNSLSRKNSNGVASGSNGVVLGPVVYPANIPTAPVVAFGLEESQKVRGTGTFIPNMGSCSCSRGRPSQGPRGRDQLHRDVRKNGVIPASSVVDLFGNGRHDAPNAESTVQGCRSKSSSSSCQSHNNSNSYAPVELEFGSIVTVLEGNNSKLTSNGRSSTPSVVGPELQSSRPVLGKNKERIVDSSSSAFHLKNEDDFPPLSA